MSRMDTDPTTPAERVASAISAFVAATALRLAHAPTSPVTEGERATYATMRDALNDLVNEADARGYQRAYRGITRPGGTHEDVGLLDALDTELRKGGEFLRRFRAWGFNFTVIDGAWHVAVDGTSDPIVDECDLRTALRAVIEADRAARGDAGGREPFVSGGELLEDPAVVARLRANGARGCGGGSDD